MALRYVHGKWLHDRAVKNNDPVAILVKRVWSSEHSAQYKGMRKAVVRIIGRRRWDLLYKLRPMVGKEMFYRAVYDAIRSKTHGVALSVLPSIQLAHLAGEYCA